MDAKSSLVADKWVANKYGATAVGARRLRPHGRGHFLFLALLMLMVCGTALAVPPVASNVAISGTAEVGFNLTGSYTYSDPEGNPEFGTSFRWLRDGTPIAGATTQLYSLTAADVGALIVFEVTPRSIFDPQGQNVGAPVQSGPAGPVVPANTAPTASNVNVSGTPEVGQTLNGTYTYNDADGDNEGATTFRWFRNNTPIGGASGTSYTLVAADNGANIRFGVTPVAVSGVSPGTEAVSAPVGPVTTNTPPVANNVSIDGNPVIGETLTGDYDYNDAQGDPESGTTFRWLRGGSPIGGATQISYQIVQADVGQTLTFEVTPRAASGASPGSPASAQVSVNNTAPIITGQEALTTDEDTALTITLDDLQVVDPDNDYPADFSLIVLDGANYDRAGATITPDDDFNGTLTVPVRVNDGASNSPVFDLTVTVTAVDDAPRIRRTNPNPLTTPEDTALEIVVADLVIDDPDSNVFTLALQDGTDYTRVGNTITPAPNFNGELRVPATVTDDTGLTSAVANLRVDVEPVNDAPTLAAPIGPQNAVESSEFVLDVSVNFDDVDQEDLTYAATGLPASGNIAFDTQTGTFSGTPLFEDADPTSVYDLTVTATDAAGAFVSDAFQLTVAALDRANVSLSIAVAPEPAIVNDELQWTFTAANPVGPQAASNLELTGSFVGEGLTVTANDPGTCTVQPAAGQVTDVVCSLTGVGVGATSSVSLSTATSQAGHVNVFATAVGVDAVPIDPNPEDNSDQLAAGVAETYSNGALQVLGSSDVLSIAAGDVNGDGAADLVVGTVAGQPIQIFLSDGLRSFAASPLLLADDAANEGLALADFNGDGTLDLAVANGAGVADVVYANDGAAGFSTMAVLGTTAGRDVAAGDFNNDGNADIAVAAFQGNPVFVGDGIGGFTLTATLGSADSVAVAAGLLDGDALDDLVFANADGASRVWLSTGSGFTPGSELALSGATSVVIGEFGGDERPDLAFGRIAIAAGDVPANPVLINDGAGGFAAAADFSLGTAPTAEILAGDVNRDGSTDLVFINESGVHEIWLASGTGFDLYSEQIVDVDSTAGVLTELGTVDATDDGGVDLAMGGAVQAGAGVFLNDGSGNLGLGDGVPPVLTLLGEATVNVPSGSNYTDAGASATDNIDGDISASIVVASTVNTAVVGTYTVTYNVTDFAGNSAAPITRTVQVDPAAGSGGGGGAYSPYWLATLLSSLLLMVALRRRILRATNVRD